MHGMESWILGKFKYQGTRNGTHRYASIYRYRLMFIIIIGWFVVKNKSGRSFPISTHISFIADKPSSDETEKKEESSIGSEALGMSKLGGGLGSLAKLGSGLLGGSDNKAPKQTRVHKYHYPHVTSFADQHQKELQILSVKLPVKSMDLVSYL